jgi:hypothetical protein
MIASGAIRGTAMSALQVHCGEKTLELSRLEHVLKYTAQIKYYANEITSKPLLSHWTDWKQYRNVSNSIQKHKGGYWNEQQTENEAHMTIVKPLYGKLKS